MAVANEVQLKVDDIYMAFGGFRPDGVSLEVKKGEIFSVIVPMVLGNSPVKLYQWSLSSSER